MTRPSKHPSAIDLFAGVGGLSNGLSAAGFSVRAAVELDPTSATSYRLNHPDTPLLVGDIRKVRASPLLRLAQLIPGELDLLTGCPPCQGYSSLRTRRRKTVVADDRNDLIFDILRLVRSTRPKVVLLENVPGLAGDRRFRLFRAGLRSAGYESQFAIINAEDFGVPQRRRRLVLLAMRGKPLPLEWWNAHGSVRRTVRDAIAHMPAPGASGDPLHDAPEVRSASVMARIRATPPDGGGQRNLAPEHRCPCHQRSDGYSDVYGRMEWDAASPTITGGCHNPSKGRFLHPVADRAITLREAALLQSFPHDYRFDMSRGKEHVAWQIGNAFPPQLILPIARTIRKEIST